ncbi:MAG: Bax inhibitor-1/YccA family protein [Gammaproteobacteria bacterium]|nr:Bax inhibitor-1/YccA family protein [Gammaproteobacteria bacterium]MBT8152011.1 Bax inhibitor-1/YccA family protein [Gammaproteobacteria bacterium]NND40203.1 Bax inhibitor-1/YccA family protein [Pseudomonadales bacterium]NNM12228.1 Bax inhibitor-1/YccA family protein [Pseudomonadales bacterium]RZV58540.1 MAG: Bax inhibitor-1/YccA family protein [Pseudomonadales bacterium]
MQDRQVFDTRAASVGTSIATHKVLKNTYMLLALTLAFSALAAFGAMAVGIGRGASLGMSLGALALIWFVLPRTWNSASGIWVVFAFTGLLGASLGPLLSIYLAMDNGPALVMQALGGTALVFFGLSGYALTTRKDFSFMGGFLVVGLIVAIVASIANMFFAVPAVSLAISAGIVLVMSGFILFDTSRIVNGGETNYVRATVSLYLNIYNLFTSMLHLLGAMDD